MEWFDANCFIGRPLNGLPRPVPTARELVACLDTHGVSKALVWHVAQHDLAPQIGNRLLAEQIACCDGRLRGCWTLLPGQCGEQDRPDVFCDLMAEHRIAALRAFPDRHKYVLCRETMGDMLEELTVRRIPLMLSPNMGCDWMRIYGLLRDCPELTCILYNVGLWPADRWFRPLIEEYPNTYVEISDYRMAWGIEAFVQRYGASRMLFGSDFPRNSYGGNILMLRHAAISRQDRMAIAGGNLCRLMGAQA